MSDDFAPYPDVSEFMATRLAQRIAAKTGQTSTNTPLPPGTFDPYASLIKKKNQETNGDIAPNTVQKFPAADIKRLQDYCTKMGIAGFNSNLPPIAALGLLKKQLGDDYTDVPLEERCPIGYEKVGISSGYGPNYPYSQAMVKKQILHG